MVFKKVIKSLVVGLVMLQASSVVGQPPQEGYYEIPTELQGIVTSSMLDSMRTIVAAKAEANLHIDYDSLGNLMWYGSVGIKWLSNDTNKVKATTFSCLENGWVKSETQFDTLSKTEDYDIYTACYDVLGNNFWTESIALDVVDSNEVKINSPVDVLVEIYKAYTFSQRITEFSVVGNGIDQSFQVNLENNTSYIVVFINNENEVVNIKRIGG